jgi:CBS domain-containing protein
MKAAEVMSQEVISIAPDAGIAEAARLMLHHDISGLPVINDQNLLVGMITERDLLRHHELGTQAHRPRWVQALLDPAFLSAERSRAAGRTVAEVMSGAPATVTEATPLGKVADLMQIHGVKRLPVIRGTLVVGIVSRKDLLRAFADIGQA